MNIWIQRSMEYANNDSYLDDLFAIYPTIPGDIRPIGEDNWNSIKSAFEKRDDFELIKQLLRLELFPIKDSYIAYLRRDNNAIYRNPATISRICSRLYEMGLDKIYENSSRPIETNRQIGPMFSNWLGSGNLGLTPVPSDEFLNSDADAILSGTDTNKSQFAREYLNYNGGGGLDFVARINRQMIIGEAKFLTDFGGHQANQFFAAMRLLESSADAIKIAILDGIIYIPGNNRMHQTMITEYQNRNIMSALLLHDFIGVL
ncbi:MAG: restriction endonuclease [Candidatus Cloacimonetes bacterium]|nr:restriction endonuclease [Candidatus Cloacimonadota bacterium]